MFHVKHFSLFARFASDKLTVLLRNACRDREAACGSVRSGPDLIQESCGKPGPDKPAICVNDAT